jgi:dTDP-D-glucose 4,6-dehydratase
MVTTNVEPEFDALPDRLFEQERSADTTFLAQQFGLTTQTSLKRGLEKTIAWYRQELNSSI